VIDPALVTLVGVVIVALIFIVAAVAPRRRAGVELGAVPLYQERCSVTVSMIAGMRFGGNLPVWRVSLYDSFLVVSLFRQWVIPYNEISSVRGSQLMPSKGLEIQLRTTPNKVWIFARRPERMIEILRERALVA
jgi:hypothetical protein